MPPEQCAYALARYSRSPDSIHQSVEWVRTHEASRFLESYYFQYGHASIADLGHLVLCLEGISELAATEVEDEPLWDGQARSSRYQDFARAGFVTPPGLPPPEEARYRACGGELLEAYGHTHARMCLHLAGKLPRPDGMKEEAYRRAIAARAFDVARYLLFLGVPTSVGQVVSIRTLEKQIRRLKISEYPELREIAGELASACAAPPQPVAPTLAQFVEADRYALRARENLALWARQNLPPPSGAPARAVELLRPRDNLADIVATLLYTVSRLSYAELYELAAGWPAARRNEVIELAVAGRGQRDDLLRAFRGGPYVFDIVMDIGAWRDLHRHRRCHQYRQAYSDQLGFETPPLLAEAGLEAAFQALVRRAHEVARTLPGVAAHYLLPFATRSRFLFKMDFAELDYIVRVRTAVKGHFSYRQVAWEMKQRLAEQEPDLARTIEATPPSIEDPLTR
jgi:thymidylate synthase ThyX